MDWWLDSVFGNTTEAHDAALSKLPAELVALMKERGLDANLSATSEAKLPPELMEITSEYFNADASALPMALEQAKEHRIKLMKARSAFVQTAEAGWQQHSYSFCEH
jgi:predicted secreted protein